MAASTSYSKAPGCAAFIPAMCASLDLGALLQHLSFIRCLHLAGAREKIGRVANRQAKKPFPHFVGEQVLGRELPVQPWRRTEHEKTRLVLRERGLETGEFGRAGGDTVGAS